MDEIRLQELLATFFLDVVYPDLCQETFFGDFTFNFFASTF